MFGVILCVFFDKIEKFGVSFCLQKMGIIYNIAKNKNGLCQACYRVMDSYEALINLHFERKETNFEGLGLLASINRDYLIHAEN